MEDVSESDAQCYGVGFFNGSNELSSQTKTSKMSWIGKLIHFVRYLNKGGC